ncbi:ATP-binding cassette domain-containing protein, partial [Pseudomonas aeruginosa]|nr:ATP-binding cassette domain-containing protein [Pseudomonas aeruginosa]
AEAQMEAIGRSYRGLVEGLVDVLRARASLKGEFRMAQTMIQPVQNNPLKFAPNVDEAMLLLLRRDNQAFLRVIPRVATLDVVMEPALARGWSRDSAELRARSLLARLNIPERLWQLAPGTFSGGEQQRVNIARGFMVEWPILLLDEPTAAFDQGSEKQVIDYLQQWLGKRTLVITTHKKSMLALVERAVVLRQGRVIMDGPLEQVVQGNQVQAPQAAEGGNHGL